MYQPRFFQKLASFAFFPLAGGPLCLLLSVDIFAGPNGALLSGNSADRNHDSRPALASSSGRYKIFCHTACMKQPSVKGFPFFRLEQKRKPWLYEGACWASVVTGCLLEGSKLSLRAFRSLWILTRYYQTKKKEEKEEKTKKKEEENINIYNYKKREEKQTEKKRHNITNLAT